MKKKKRKERAWRTCQRGLCVSHQMAFRRGCAWFDRYRSEGGDARVRADVLGHDGQWCLNPDLLGDEGREFGVHSLLPVRGFVGFKSLPQSCRNIVVDRDHGRRVHRSSVILAVKVLGLAATWTNAAFAAIINPSDPRALLVRNCCPCHSIHIFHPHLPPSS